MIRLRSFLERDFLYVSVAIRQAIVVAVSLTLWPIRDGTRESVDNARLELGLVGMADDERVAVA